ncbi:MAG: BadF/BadG/BcrA/BcrD ATPase family protein [Syntrophobacteraceae bacterium]
MTNYYLGIDLGSTTSKAIIIDDRHQIVGRGITNTRSNYDVAVEVAKNEAKINARFTFMRQELDGPHRRDAGLEAVFADLEIHFRYEQHLDKLLRLKERALREAKQSAFDPQIVVDIFARMVPESYEVFLSLGTDKSRFFRDIAGMSFMRLAEEISARSELFDFETLMSIYDKSIVPIENELVEIDFLHFINRAVERMGDRITLDLQDEFRRASLKAVERPFEIATMVGTGYGRTRLPFPRECIKSEILCHGLGAHYMYPETATVLDIGGQDTKAIQLDKQGVVTSFHMNDRCAAGCGRFLGYIADELNIGLHELGPLAMQHDHVTRVNSTCTVFSGVELRERLSLGERRENVLAGLHRAMVLRAMSLLARSGGIHSEFTFTGGVAKNIAVVYFLKELMYTNYGRDITLNINPDSIYTGAVGGSIFAKRIRETS